MRAQELVEARLLGNEGCVPGGLPRIRERVGRSTTDIFGDSDRLPSLELNIDGLGDGRVVRVDVGFLHQFRGCQVHALIFAIEHCIDIRRHIPDTPWRHRRVDGISVDPLVDEISADSGEAIEHVDNRGSAVLRRGHTETHNGLVDIQLVREQLIADLERAGILLLRSPCILPGQHTGLEIKRRLVVADGRIVDRRIQVHVIAQIQHETTPVRYTADHALSTVLVQPWEVRAFRLRLLIVEASNARKGLS